MQDLIYYCGVMNKEKMKDFILASRKPIRYNNSSVYRDPKNYSKILSKEEACRIIDLYSLVDVKGYNDCILLSVQP